MSGIQEVGREKGKVRRGDRVKSSLWPQILTITMCPFQRWAANHTERGKCVTSTVNPLLKNAFLF